ncbi:hypothetical protein GCM10010251_14110 [Streptomyces aurantiogriseus]|uniref:Uncharacterized protein n=1 Tax=Streptomyces aurantiogriseus TaxID=66870 RepID=A0A918C0V7_9ACTN|nr:hypothetical protein GCM10010251_14110 [Streptomyces aurantiogriseus]
MPAGGCRGGVARPRRPYPSRPQGLRPFDPTRGLRPLDPRGAAPLHPTPGYAPGPHAGLRPWTPAGLRPCTPRGAAAPHRASALNGPRPQTPDGLVLAGSAEKWRVGWFGQAWPNRCLAGWFGRVRLNRCSAGWVAGWVEKVPGLLLSLPVRRNE